MVLRDPLPSESPALIALGISTGLFSPDEAKTLLGDTLDAFHGRRLGDDHRVGVWSEAPGSAPLGWAYFAPDPHAPKVWNLWWIGVAPAHQGAGVGRALMGAIERSVRGAGGRLLVVETSARPALDRTRRFYGRLGYTRCGEVPDFYGDGEGKVVFARRVGG